MAGLGQITDKERDYYASKLSVSSNDSINDLKSDYYKDVTSRTSGNITDNEREFLFQQTGKRNIVDARKAYLIAQGYNTHITDDNRDFWEDNA